MDMRFPWFAARGSTRSARPRAAEKQTRLPLRALALHALDDQLQKLARPPRQGVDAVGLGGPRHARGEDVLAAQRHGAAGEGDRVQQAVVVDLAQARAAVPVRRREGAVVLDAE